MTSANGLIGWYGSTSVELVEGTAWILEVCTELVSRTRQGISELRDALRNDLAVVEMPFALGTNLTGLYPDVFVKEANVYGLNGRHDGSQLRQETPLTGDVAELLQEDVLFSSRRPFKEADLSSFNAAGPSSTAGLDSSCIW